MATRPRWPGSISIDYLAGYLVNEYGRQALSHLPVVRRRELRGPPQQSRRPWRLESFAVTEDTDLTIRLVLAGERVRFDVTAVDEEEGVVTMTRVWRQRYRWARGHQQVCRDFRGPVLRSDRLTLGEKVETLLFLHVFHLPVASALGLVILVGWLAGFADPGGPVDLYVLWTLLFLGPLLELGSGLLISGADRREAAVLAYFMPVFFVSIALCTKAWIDGIAGRPYEWAKTARSGDPLARTGAPA